MPLLQQHQYNLEAALLAFAASDHPEAQRFREEQRLAEEHADPAAADHGPVSTAGLSGFSPPPLPGPSGWPSGVTGRGPGPLKPSSMNELSGLMARFLEATGEDRDDVARAWLAAHKHNLEAALRAYHKETHKERDAAPAGLLPPTTSELSDLMARFSEATGERTDVARAWLAAYKHDLEDAVSACFTWKSTLEVDAAPAGPDQSGVMCHNSAAEGSKPGQAVDAGQQLLAAGMSQVGSLSHPAIPPLAHSTFSQTEPPTSNSPFDLLPPQLLLKILWLVPLDERTRSCALVCGYWTKAVASIAVGSATARLPDFGTAAHEQLQDLREYLEEQGKGLGLLDVTIYRQKRISQAAMTDCGSDSNSPEIPVGSFSLPCSKLTELFSLRLEGLEVQLKFDMPPGARAAAASGNSVQPVVAPASGGWLHNSTLSASAGTAAAAAAAAAAQLFNAATPYGQPAQPAGHTAEPSRMSVDSPPAAAAAAAAATAAAEGGSAAHPTQDRTGLAAALSRLLNSCCTGLAPATNSTGSLQLLLPAGSSSSATAHEPEANRHRAAADAATDGGVSSMPGSLSGAGSPYLQGQQGAGSSASLQPPAALAAAGMLLLPALCHLQLVNCSFSLSHFAQLSRMTNLTSLQVAGLQFPLEQLKPVSSRRASETLTSTLSQLTGLSELTVGNGPYLDAAGLATMARMPQLHRISLWNGSCQFSTITALSNHVTSLRLGRSSADSCSEESSTFWCEVRSALTRLSGLQELQLTGFTVPSDVVTVRPDLLRLGLHSVQAEGAALLAQLRGAPAVGQLTALQNLHLSNMLTHMHLSELHGVFNALGQLTALHISSSSGHLAGSALNAAELIEPITCELTDPQCLPQLRVLTLQTVHHEYDSYVDFTGFGFFAVHFSKLDQLDIIVQPPPAVLLPFVKITSLSGRHRALLSDSTFALRMRLKELWVSGRRCRDAAAEWVGQCFGHITCVTWAGQQLSDVALERLKGLTDVRLAN